MDITIIHVNKEGVLMKLSIDYYFRLTLIAIVIGVATGALAVVFNEVLSVLVFLMQTIIEKGRYVYIVLPVLAGLIMSGFYRYAFEGDEKGFGVAQVLVEIRLITLQVLKPIGVFWRVCASLVTLCFGLTAGRFGPIVHLGASMGAWIAYSFKLEATSIRLFIGCGIAGTIATVFGLPLFAAVFVLEVIFRESIYQNIAPLLLTAFVSSQISQFFGVNNTLIPFPIVMDSMVLSPSMLVHITIIGVLSGFASICYILSIETCGMLFSKIPSRLSRLVLAGFLVGVSAYVLPLQFDLHSRTFYTLLNSYVPITTLVLFIMLHIATTGITLGSGFIGGNFFPGLTTGTALGILYAQIISHMGYSVNRSEFGLMSAVSMLSGFLNAPLSAVVLCVEVSQSLKYVMPALLACGVAVSIVQSVLKRDVFTKGVNKLTSLYSLERGTK
jgi:CIC family chloride channel protein